MKKDGVMSRCEDCTHFDTTGGGTTCISCTMYSKWEQKPVQDQGSHFDEGKPRVDLIPPVAMLGMGKVFGFGAGKYGDRNWEKGVKNSKLLGSTLRHLIYHMAGETNDPESSLLHLEHAATDIAMLLDNMAHRPEMDDRSVKR